MSSLEQQLLKLVSKHSARGILIDAGLTSLVQMNTLLLTDDLDLYISAVSIGGDAINFTHVREAAGTV